MYLSKRKNGFYYVYYIQENGKRTCKSTGEKFKHEALKFFTEFSQKRKEQKRTKYKSISLSEFIIKFLIYSESIHSINTSKVFKVTFKQLHNFVGNVQLHDITSQKLNEFFIIRTKKSIYAARKDLINLSSAFSYAVKQNYIIDNPCKEFKRIRLPEKQPLFFTESQFQTLLHTIDEKDIKNLVEFDLQTGLRQMELITLQWSQIKYDEKILILDNRNYLTKSKKIRTIPLSQKALQILSDREKLKVSEYIFTLNGEVITQKYISKKFKSYVLKADINPKLNFHSIRHTFASWLVQKGVSIFVVSKLLGHSDIKTTQIYSHLRIEDLHNAIKTLED